MGVPIEVYRQRIGRYSPRGWRTSRAAGGGSLNISLNLRVLPLGVIVVLLLIAGVEQNPGPTLTCKFCNQLFEDVAQFCDHAKLHGSTKNFVIRCGFPNCSAQLSTVGSFKTHVSRSHVAKVMRAPAPTVTAPTSVPCPVANCNSVVTSREFYSKHMVDNHLKRGDTFQCIFQGCSTLFSHVAQFRTHLSRYHRSCNVVESPEPTYVFFDDENDDNDCLNHSIFEESPPSNHPEEEIDLYPDCLIKEELAKFYLRLESVHFVPGSTVQLIAKEIKVMVELCHYRLKKALVKELSGINMDKELVASVVNRTFKNDTVFNVHHIHEDSEQLGTDHSRTQYYKKNFPYVPVQEISLGVSATGKPRKAHYVSIRESLNVLLRDAKVKAAVLKSFDYDISTEPHILSDYMDGSAYRDHRKLHEGPCLQLFLFQDAFDFNAFVPSSGVYKPVGYYYSLGNIPAIYRSKVDLIQLVYMILENDMKCSQAEEIEDLDKIKQSLKPLIDELKELKVNGIDIDGQIVPVCLLFLLGDSLGQNTVGGYVKNFSSSEFSCRFCPMSKTEFIETPHEVKPLRTANQYDEYSAIAKRKWLALRRKGIKDQQKAKEQAKRAAQRIANRSKAPSKRDLTGIMSKTAYKKMTAVNFKGVKYRPSAFNMADLNFHVVGAQPPCLAHDLFEGIVKSVLAHILKYFIESKCWFTLTTLNRRIKSFKCKGSDARDAPAPMKTLDKLGGNACQNWNMLRLLPFMIIDLIEDTQDPMWQLYLLLKQICEFVCAPKISLPQISFLQFIIESFLARIKELLSMCLTPKCHYLCHYPGLILTYGPLIRLFTLRFESKHSFFKNVVRACKNYKNITYTMAKKYTSRFAYDHGSSDLLPLDIVYNTNFTVGVSSESIPQEYRHVFPPTFNWADVEELRSVVVNGITYDKDFNFVLRSEGTNLIVGCIKQIFLQRESSTVKFLLEEKFAENTFNGYFMIQPKRLGVQLSGLTDLPDYYALPSYTCNGKECLALKHSVITMD